MPIIQIYKLVFENIIAHMYNVWQQEKGAIDMAGTRVEKDLVGARVVPEDAYYGIHSLRAQENFPITGHRLHPRMIESLAHVKKACAEANRQAGAISEPAARAIEQACDEILAGRFRDQFIVDPVQGGAGTSTNMNANEVIANRAIEILGGTKGDYTLVNPNDHVNRGQSTNDVYPSCGRMTAYMLMDGLLKALDGLIAAFLKKAEEFDGVIKMGRTQLQDAVPMRLGQEFQAYARVMEREKSRLVRARQEMLILNLGGTAVGTRLNADPVFVERVVPILAEQTGLPFVQCDNLIDGTQNADAYPVLSGALKGAGMSLSKICNDLRLMSSGPRTGLSEIVLPARQNGSSIMPGKVNPVIPEVVTQVAFRLAGFDATVSMAAEAGQLELNAFEPVIFDSLNQGIEQFAHAVETLTVNCVEGITASETACRAEVERSIGIVTALCPTIGYTAACHLAQEALKTGTPVRELVVSKGLLTGEQVEKALDPVRMTGC